MVEGKETSNVQDMLRIVLGLFMFIAGTSHLTFLRTEFQAQVPNWIPLDKDEVIVVSGVLEIALGLAMLFWKKQRLNVGIALAVFYLLIFPGNIAQYINHVNAFGLDSNQARLLRLFIQPLLILGSLWSTGALN